MAQSTGGARRGARVSVFLERALLGHVVAYPVGFLAAVAAIPIALPACHAALSSVGGRGPRSAFVRDLAQRMALSPPEGAQLEIVLKFLLWVALAVLLLVHVAVLPWAIASARGSTAVDRARRMFVRTVATITAIIVVTGAAGWIWLYSL